MLDEAEDRLQGVHDVESRLLGVGEGKVCVEVAVSAVCDGGGELAGAVLEM